jgi:hypothetical protein
MGTIGVSRLSGKRYNWFINYVPMHCSGFEHQLITNDHREHRTEFIQIQFNSIQFNSIQFNSIQFNSIQFNSIQFNSIQFNSIQFNSIQSIAINDRSTGYPTVQHPGFSYSFQIAQWDDFLVYMIQRILVWGG